MRRDRPKVLYLTYNFTPKLGGLEQVVSRTHAALRERADVVTLAQGARAHVDELERVHRPAGEGVLRFLGFLYTRGRRRVAGEQFDLVVSGSALTALPALHLARRHRARSVAINYGLDVIHPARIYQRVYRHAMPRIDRVIAISRATRDEAIARGVARERITVIPPGCDSSAFQRPRPTQELRERWGLGDAPVILSAGRLVARKGLDGFVARCLPQVVRSLPDTKLLVAGGNPVDALAHTDDIARQVQRTIERSGMSEHVVVTGRLSDDELVAAFQLADVFVLPAVPTPGDMEGFGIVLLEAGAAGLPVVATALGGITDAVEDGETGRLVAPGDYSAMAAALVDLLRDEGRRRAYGRSGQVRALGEFDWGPVSQRYAEAILTA